MADRMSSFLVAGTHSGCGKTTLTLGLMAALKRRGHRVQPFKVGPDFIDPGHHRWVTGRESQTLDGWMLKKHTNLELFARMHLDAEVVAGEGVMGLFDGFSGTDEAGSTAQMAKWLGLPVILVVDAGSMARSVAALVHGYTQFDPQVQVAGVLCNRVGSPGHARILEQALQGAGCPPALGFLPKEGQVRIPSRHLGLVTAQDMHAPEETGETLADWVEAHVDVDRLLNLTAGSHLPCAHGTVQSRDCRRRGQKDQWGHNSHLARGGHQSSVRIAVARDEAFCFYYPENLRLLEQAGAELVPFSPLRDECLPPAVQGLYLGGGYPEVHAVRLAANTGLHCCIRAFANRGGAVYAECGGFMYCMQELIDAEDRIHPMLGLFPFRARMQDRFRALGYREVELTEKTLLGPAGTRLRGHEFHYSALEDDSGTVERVYTITARRGGTTGREGYRVHNVLGSYVHLHFGSCPQAAEHFTAFCRQAAGGPDFSTR